jgi:transcriptional regulator with XRE-family HTH domain
MLRTDGPKVRSLRKEAGISILELSERVGVTRQYLSYIEVGKRNASPELLAAISGELGEPAEALVIPEAGVTSDLIKTWIEASVALAARSGQAA